ncbi:MAG TPA: hypothetical protein VKK31_15035 [Thermoanaerobaculia bacterium]|nr:hypothetical protein [Thermoanaerobaculia bacterium]
MPETYYSFRNLLEKHFGMRISAARLEFWDRGISLDGYAYSEAEVYLGKVKFALNEEGTEKFLQILQEFRELCPLHKARKIYGVLAAREISDGVRDWAWSKGLYLAQIHEDDNFELQIPEGFHPRAF